MSTSTKHVIWRIEYIVTSARIIKWLILTPHFFISRLMWAWGRLRFSTLVRNRGLGCICHWNADLKYPDNIFLGKEVVIGVNASIGAHSPVFIGDRVRISKDVQIETAGLDFLSATPPYPHTSKPITISDGVWIGTRSLIMGGVTIGANAVVAAGSIVTRDVPARCLVGGVPAKVIRYLPELEKDPSNELCKQNSPIASSID